MRRFFITLIFLSIEALASSPRPFTLQDIGKYLKEDNPFYYRAIGEQFIAKAASDAAYGVTDLKLDAAYDDKRYAVTKGEYQSLFVTQNLLNGVSLTAGYRRAEGLQEYNNIKTGNDGEIQAGIRFSLFSLINDISKNKVDIEQAKLHYLKSQDRAALKLLNLKFNMAKLYYQVRFAYTRLHLEKQLLQKARKHRLFVAKKIKSGMLPASTSIEIEQIVLQRRARVARAQNDFLQTRNLFVQYLGLSIQEFEHSYRIKRLTPRITALPSQHTIISDAIVSRPELKLYERNRAGITLDERYNELNAYGDVTVGFTGNYDLLYKEGYKTTLNFSLPLQRTAYKGSKEKLRLQKMLNQSEKLAWIEELRTKIANIYVAHRQITQGIKLLKMQLQKSLELEKIEKRKLAEGVGSLIFVNQREIGTLQIQDLLMQDYLQLRINELTLQYYRNAFPF